MMRYLWSLAVCTTVGLVSGQAGNCTSSALHPSIPNGGQVLDISAVPVSNYAHRDTTLDFCNVTVTYTHPDWHDTIHISIWLPSSNWSQRLQGAGGSGLFGLKSEYSLAEAVMGDYAVVGTDTGHIHNGSSSDSWWQDASGNVNIPLLTDFASVALNDAGVVAKQVVRDFYGHGPRYSYWNGCSTGGRQGLMLAQRYPTLYDGIMANAPAINWAKSLVAEFWPQAVMNQMGHHPPSCILNAIAEATVQACDANDGVRDRVITDPDNCRFDPATLINHPVNCTGQTLTITSKDVEVVTQTWNGMRGTNGSFLWYGLEKGASLTAGLAMAHCSNGRTNCVGVPFPISADWISHFLLENPSADLSRLGIAELEHLFHKSFQKYNSIIGTDNPDLSAFRQAGGKMLTWQGLADQLIFPKGTLQYYHRVEDRDPSVRDFYRLFLAPGVNHCRQGEGALPIDALKPVIDWVENGIAPETVPARTLDRVRTRDLCPYPLMSVYKGGDDRLASSYACEGRYTM